MASEQFTQEEAAELERLRRDFEARSDGGASPAVASLRRLWELEAKEEIARAAREARLNLWRVEATAHTVYGAHLGEALKSAAGPVARVWRPGSTAFMPDLVFQVSADGKTWICTFPCAVADGA